MKCLGRDVTKLINLYFEKWQKTQEESHIIHVCFHFLKQKFAKKEQTHCVEHGNLTDMT